MHLKTDSFLLMYDIFLEQNFPKPKQTLLFLFMKKGYFQTRIFLLISQKIRPEKLFEKFSIVLCVYLYLRQQ